MRIALLVEGDTEKAFMPVLREWLRSKVARMPEIRAIPKDGRIAKEDKLKREVRLLLGASGFDYVVALTDVYTGTDDFKDAADAKAKMRAWVGEESRFIPHAAQHDFEAWLLPFWSEMQKKAGHDKTLPKTSFEQINHNHPPAHRLQELFWLGKKRKYVQAARGKSRPDSCKIGNGGGSVPRTQGVAQHFSGLVRSISTGLMPRRAPSFKLAR